MERYQLRLKATQSLDDVLAELVQSVWALFSSRKEFAGLNPEDKKRLGSGIRKALSGFAVRYDTCGLGSICEESLEPAQWNKHPDPALAPRRPWEAEEIKRVAVRVERDLGQVVDALEAEIYRELFTSPERAHLAKAFKVELSESIKETLGARLYHNMACGQCEICKEAKALPLP